MKKYIKLIPVIIYPYAYIIALAIYIFIFVSFEGFMDTKFAEYMAIGIICGYQILSIGMAIYGSICAAGDNYTVKEAAKVNMVVKGIHIPSYILHFFMCILGICMSVWGIGFFLTAVIVSIITMFISGIHSIGCMVKMKKENILSTTKAILFGIGSFIIIIDVILAIIIVRKSYKKKDEKMTFENPYEYYDE